MATETPAQMAARFRKMAQDPKLPQAVKNTYLDKANAVEKAAAKPTMAKGGMVKPPIKKQPLPPMKGKPPINKLPKPTMMAKGGAVKTKPKKYAEGGLQLGTMRSQAGMASQSSMQKQAPTGMPQQAPTGMQKQAPTGMPQQAPMGMPQQQNMGGGNQRPAFINKRLQKTLESRPAYQQMQQLGSSFSRTNQPTSAQIAQMQQYQKQLETDPQLMRLRGKAQNLQQQQNKQQADQFLQQQPQPRAMTLQNTQTLANGASRQATQQGMAQLQGYAAIPPQEMAQLQMQAARLQQGQPPMAKGGMVVAKALVKKKPATKPMTKMAKGGKPAMVLVIGVGKPMKKPANKK